MHGTILVVDSDNVAQPLVRRLERNGFTCHHARGPLRLRELLAQGAVDVILWEEGPGRTGIGDDLAREWGVYPDVPVVHLFPQGGSAESAAGSGQVVESLPRGVPIEELVTVLQRLCGRVAAAPAPGTPPPGPSTELAFRRVLVDMLKRPTPEQTSAESAPLPATSLNAAERAGLRPVPASTERRSLRWPWQRRRRTEDP